MTLPQSQTITEQPEPQAPLVSERDAQPEKKPPAATGKKQEQEKAPVEKPPSVPKQQQEKATAEKPVEKTPAEKTPAQPVQPKAQEPVYQPPQPASQPEKKPPETRDRIVYFIQEGNGGADLQLVKASRKLEISNSPLLDCLNAVLAGPNAEEKKRGFITCIPPNSRIISARVDNNTVVLNFNEEFRYNTQGREDSIAQLRQIVWTATEFSNVNEVQIQIGGKTVDFLTEGVSIRNPIKRY
ncbi:MAG: GerMN domain-containing protein [Treponema sp.]|nr:GerMN domain-containing protein [Treponema sp.]